MKKLRFAQRAKQDLDDIWLWIAKDSVPGAEDVLEAILDATQQLQTFPDSGRPGRREGTRELVVARAKYRYVIAYRVLGNAVMIARVLHHARRWPKRV